MNELPKDYHETIIRLDHDTGTAEIWTENRGVLGRAKRNGWQVKKTHQRGVWLSAPLNAILIRKPRTRRPRGANPGAFGRKP